MNKYKFSFTTSFFSQDKSTLGLDICRGTMKFDDEPHSFVDITIGFIFFFFMFTIMKKKEGE